MLPQASETEPAALAAQFQALVDRWKAAMAVTSSTTSMVKHPAYQAIITLGPAVLPLVLRDLERDSAHWFEALQALTGEDPVAREDWGRIPAMRRTWLTVQRYS